MLNNLVLGGISVLRYKLGPLLPHTHDLLMQYQKSNRNTKYVNNKKEEEEAE